MDKQHPANCEGNSFSFIDLETGSKRANASILTIGVSTVDLNRNLISELYINVKLDEGLNTQRLTDQDTLSWWQEQDKAVRDEAFNPPVAHTLENALTWLAVYIRDLRKKGNAYVFGNGSEFDIAILSDAYAQANKPEPWDFRHVHSVRTAALIAEIALGVDFKRSSEFVGKKHHALHDARHEMNYSMDSISALRFAAGTK